MSTARLTLREVADLAGVGQPAVSNWRARHTDTFPQPDESNTFDRDEIISWLNQHRGRTARPRRESRARTSAEELRNAAAAVSANGQAPYTALALITLAVLTPDEPPVDPLTLAENLEARGTIARGALTEPLAATEASRDALGVALAAARQASRQESPSKIFDAIVAQLPRTDIEGAAANSPQLAAFLSELLPPRASTVFDPTAGTGAFLAHAGLRTGARASLSGAERDRRTWQVCLQRLALNDVRAVVSHDGAMPGEHAGPFDFVAVQPELGTRPTQDPQVRTQFGFGTPIEEYEWIGRAARHWAPTGLIAAAVAPNTLFAEAPTAVEFRRDLLVHERIHAILLLPKGLLSNPQAPTAVWIVGAEGSARSVFMYRAPDDHTPTSALRQAAAEYHRWVAKPAEYEPVRDVTSVHRVLELLKDTATNLTPTRWVISPPSPDTARRGAEHDLNAVVSSLAQLGTAPAHLRVEFIPTHSQSTSLADMVAAGKVEVLRGRLLPKSARTAAPNSGEEFSHTTRLAPVYSHLDNIPDNPAGFLDPDAHPALTTRPGDVILSTQGAIRAEVDTDGGHLLCAPLWIIRPRTPETDPYLLAMLLSSSRTTAAALTGTTVSRIRDPRGIILPLLPADDAAHAAALARTINEVRTGAKTTAQLADTLANSLTEALFSGIAPQPVST